MPTESPSVSGSLRTGSTGELAAALRSSSFLETDPALVAVTRSARHELERASTYKEDDDDGVIGGDGTTDDEEEADILPQSDVHALRQASLEPETAEEKEEVNRHLGARLRSSSVNSED